MDNIFIERLWRSIKYEEVHLKAYADGREARAGIGAWMTFYNDRRPHQAMNNQMPMAVWRDGMDEIEAAARAVDMPLRLDNANALPTYPQQQQKQQESSLILGRTRAGRDYTLNPAPRGPTNGVHFSDPLSHTERLAPISSRSLQPTRGDIRIVARWPARYVCDGKQENRQPTTLGPGRLQSPPHHLKTPGPSSR